MALHTKILTGPAGLDEFFAIHHSLDGLSREVWSSAIAIDCFCPTHVERDNVTHRWEHLWITEILRQHPSWAAGAYYSLAKASLEHGLQHTSGCHELVTTPELRQYSVNLVFDLLDKFPAMNPVPLTQLLSFVLPIIEKQRLLALTGRGVVACNLAHEGNSYIIWLAAAFVGSPAHYRPTVEGLDVQSARSFVWALRDLGAVRYGESHSAALELQDLTWALSFIARHFDNTVYPIDGWTGDTNPWDASQLIRHTLMSISADPSPTTTSALQDMCNDQALQSYSDECRHASAQQRIKRVDAEFRQPNFSETAHVLSNGRPTRVSDLHALTLAHLRDLSGFITTNNTDRHKRFWNENSHGRITTPKNEESCRDALVDLLRERLQPLGIIIEPEGHMAADKRADVVLQAPGIKLVIELKRDYHAEVWRAAVEQLDRFYTRDPDAKGYGIYAVFWFGNPARIPNPPNGLTGPSSTQEMELLLNNLLPEQMKSKIAAVVLDVAGTN